MKNLILIFLLSVCSVYNSYGQVHDIKKKYGKWTVVAKHDYNVYIKISDRSITAQIGAYGWYETRRLTIISTSWDSGYKVFKCKDNKGKAVTVRKKGSYLSAVHKSWGIRAYNCSVTYV